MEPKSPPEPLTYKTVSFFLVIGSFKIIFDDVLPPPKFVTFKSAPSRFDLLIN